MIALKYSTICRTQGSLYAEKCFKKKTLLICMKWLMPSYMHAKGLFVAFFFFHTFNRKALSRYSLNRKCTMCHDIMGRFEGSTVTVGVAAGCRMARTQSSFQSEGRVPGQSGQPQVGPKHKAGLWGRTAHRSQQ